MEFQERTGFIQLIKKDIAWCISCFDSGFILTLEKHSITPKEKLIVTIRFLATGETLLSLSYQYRLGHFYKKKSHVFIKKSHIFIKKNVTFL